MTYRDMIREELRDLFILVLSVFTTGSNRTLVTIYIYLERKNRERETDLVVNTRTTGIVSRYFYRFSINLN